MYISCYRLMCTCCRWSVTLPRVFIYLIGPIFPQNFFCKSQGCDRKSYFSNITICLEGKCENWILWTLGSSCCYWVLNEWQNSLFSRSGTLLRTYSIVWSPWKYIFLHFYHHLVIKLLKMAKNDPPGASTQPDKTANSGSTGQNFSIL